MVEEPKIPLEKIEKPAGILTMKSYPKLFVVIQEGGTSNEHYAHHFESERDAKKYIRSAERAAYNCYGPFEIDVPVAKSPKGRHVKRAAHTD